MPHLDNDGILVRVGRKIAVMRKRSNMTQAELAGKLHISTEDVARIENGLYKLRLGTLLKIAHVFGKRLEVKIIRGKGRI